MSDHNSTPKFLGLRVPNFCRIKRNQVALVPIREEATPVREFTPRQVHVTHQNIDQVTVSMLCGNTVITKRALYASELYAYIRERLEDTFGHPSAINRAPPQFSLVFQGRPITDRLIQLRAYGMRDGSTVRVAFHCMLGGSTPEHKLEMELRREVGDRKWRSAAKAEMELQGFSENVDDLKGRIVEILGSQHTDYILNLIEGVVVLGYQLSRASSQADHMVAIAAFAKGQVNGPLISSSRVRQLMDKFAEVFEMQAQASDSALPTFQETLSGLRGAVDSYANLRDSPIVEKLHRFLMYALSLSLFEKAGVTFDTCRYSVIEAEAIKRKYAAGPNFIHCVIDTTLFLVERGYQCMLTGSMDPIFHSGKSYDAWFSNATRLTREAKFLSNPEAHGIKLPTFLADLDDAIDKGKAIGRHSGAMDHFARRSYITMQAALEMLKSDYLSKRAAGTDRKAPFGVLVYGGSGIAKSAFTKILYYHFGKITGLDTGDEYRHVRNSNDEFWSGFKSYQWCVQLDDIAYLRADKAPGGDASILEMLQVVNSVPFVPNQAELEDKGRTPMRAQLVVATTNTKELNAFHYFQCPLAIQRRLPFVITLEVKPEYSKGEVFLDASKAPELQMGEYPDLWLIKVERVVPAGNNMATFEEVGSYSDIHEFLDWYVGAVELFRSEQDKVQRADHAMRAARLCRVCKRLEGHGKCEGQCTFVFQPQVWDTVLEVAHQGNYMIASTLLAAHRFSAALASGSSWSMWSLFASFVRMNVYATEGLIGMVMAVAFMARCERVGRYCQRVILDFAQRTGSSVMHRAGESVARKMGYAPLFFLIASSLSVTYLFMKYYFRTCIPVVVEKQGNVQSRMRKSETVGVAPKSTGESESVWYRDNFECTTFDMPAKGASWKNMDDTEVARKVGANAVVLRAVSHTMGTQRVNRALALGGQLYVTNSHGLHEQGDIQVTMTRAPQVVGLSSEYTFLLTQKEIMRTANDLAYFRVRGVPPSKVLDDLLTHGDLAGAPEGFYVKRQMNGELVQVAVTKAYRTTQMVDKIGKVEVWRGEVSEPTATGDCGSALFLRYPCGVFLAGLHVGGLGNAVASTLLTAESVRAARKQLSAFAIQGSTPLISAPSAQRTLEDIHVRSPLRFIPEGVADVFGSFPGFRGGGKSKVIDTPMRALAEAEGYQVKTAPPCMKGWEPWYIAIKEMTNPVTQLRGDVLEIVKKNFLDDIFARVTKEQLSAELMVYDNTTAINGANGVRFVDKMNRNTSMGCPWKQCKKAYMRPLPPTESCTAPYEFTDEVMDRVDEYIERYQRGERCMPVFSGSLKDEPLKLSKVESKATRVFCASPADWNVVVRKYLLSFIRVMQLNRFAFEASIGVVAQSREWEDLRAFLTRFGEDRMVAGDYKAFDKKMPPQVMLAAFDIIEEVCKASGNYTEEDLTVVRGIAMDTCFPVVDMHGDLVMFYGSNPSGHPLTVVINSLVNALYMRYTYAVLNPEGLSAAGFKGDVALQTYGDDNVMGVRKGCDWFNHTQIAEALAEVGITYTMADKEAASVPYIHIDEVSFLKRTWVWDKDVKAYLCPLDESSMAKTLTKFIPSRTVSVNQQCLDMLSSVCREYFFYGKEKYGAKRAMCLRFARELDIEYLIESNTFPVWEELKEGFDAASEKRLRCTW